MGDWAPVSGSRIQGSGAAVAVTAAGTAHTKGSWATLATTTAWTSPVLLLSLDSATEAGYLVDFGTGAAGSEVAFMNNFLLAGQARAPVLLALPFRIPAGVRLAARCQSTVASAVVNATYALVGVGYDGPVGRNLITTYGANTGTSGGTQIDPGAVVNTKPTTYTDLSSSTTSVAKALMFALGNQVNPAPTDCAWRIDIGVGASGSEQRQIIDSRAVANGTNHLMGPSPSQVYPVSIPAGSRISARANCDITDATDRLFDMVLYAFA